MNTRMMSRGFIGLTLLISASGLQPVWAQSDREDQSTTGRAAEYLREYLGDRGRAGSMAGSILGGALTAHPAGPILGGLIGFFVGKQTFFEETAAREPSQAELLRQTELFGAAPGQVGSISFAPSGGAAVLPQASALPGTAAVPQAAVVAPLAIAPPSAAAPMPGAAWSAVPSPVAPVPSAPALVAPAVPPASPSIAPAAPLLSPTAIAQLCTQGTPVADPRLRRACLYYSASPQ